MVNFKKLKPKPKLTSKKGGLNTAFILAVISLLFCWFYGIPALIAGVFSIRDYLELRKGKKKLKGFTAVMMQWGYPLAWAGTAFATFFTFYYFIAFFSGAFIRL